MKVTRAFTHLLTMMLLSGCSYDSGLFILNYSTEPLQIFYQLNNSESVHIFHSAPSFSMIQRDGNEHVFVDLPSREAEYDTKTSTISTQLLPDEGMRIGNELNLRINTEYTKDSFKSEIIDLQIIIEEHSDTLRCTGGLLPSLFQDIGKFSYGIIIE